MGWKSYFRWLSGGPKMAKIMPGSKAPSFALKSLDNKNLSLSAALAKGPVIAAYFKVNCPDRQSVV